MSQMGAAGTAASNSGVTGRGPNDVIAFPSFKQLFSTETKRTQMTNLIKDSMATWASNLKSYALSASALQTIYQVQADYILSKNVPIAELFYSTKSPA